jgi:hypothetical protein
MSDKNMKQIRNQIRQVVKETFPEIFTQEVQQKMIDQLVPTTEAGLELIRSQVVSNLERHREVQSQLENKILQAASDHLNEMNISMLAWQRLIKQQLDTACVIGPEFDKLLEAEKLKVKEELQKASEAKSE